MLNISFQLAALDCRLIYDQFNQVNYSKTSLILILSKQVLYIIDILRIYLVQITCFYFQQTLRMGAFDLSIKIKFYNYMNYIELFESNNLSLKNKRCTFFIRILFTRKGFSKIRSNLEMDPLSNTATQSLHSVGLYRHAKHKRNSLQYL